MWGNYDTLLEYFNRYNCDISKIVNVLLPKKFRICKTKKEVKYIIYEVVNTTENQFTFSLSQQVRLHANVQSLAQNVQTAVDTLAYGGHLVTCLPSQWN